MEKKLGKKIGYNVALIPARGGSKSIPLKNINLLNGKPLITYVCDAAISSNVFDDIIVATDNRKIADVINDLYPNDIIVYDRDPINARDNSPTEALMTEFLDVNDFNHICLIQATSPLLTGNDLSKAYDLLIKSEAQSVISVTIEKKFYWKHDKRGYVKPINYDPKLRPRRQDHEGTLVENGAFYITSRERFIESGTRISDDIMGYVMPPETSLEIDEPEDIAQLEKLLIERDKEDMALSSIKLVLTDVDGVLTDAGMYYGESGEEQKKFNTRDGKGFELLKKAGIQVGIITSEDTRIVERRAKKLKADFVFQGVEDKANVLKNLLKEQNIHPSEVVYIGDDINDFEIMQIVGYSFCPSNAVASIKKIAKYHCSKKGGEGCFREMTDLILH